ncbi:MAG: hypothetical protein GY940_28030 [bacterium]|nr:hypothetical protein [bacterium]
MRNFISIIVFLILGSGFLFSQTLEVTSPNGGETWGVGTTQTITWTSTGGVGTVDLEYSTDNGGSWTSIATGETNDGSYSWTIPDEESTQALVRISESADGDPVDTSDAVFSIVATITVTAPNGGESWEAGTTQTITWTTTGTVGNVKIEYSTDGGSNWSNVTQSTTNDGTHLWTIPTNAASTTCKVRIGEASDGDPTDDSDATFTITASSLPSITVGSPNAGETLVSGTTHTIEWGSANGVGNVKIEFSIDGGGSWTTIVSSTANDGSYGWTVPTAESSSCLVRISETDGSPSDTSNSFFTITSKTPTITVTSPNGGETLVKGTVHGITWTSTGGVGNVKIEYSLNNGGSWSTITGSTSNNGTYSWTVPQASSSFCRVRIREASDGSPTDTSDSAFSIASSLIPEISLSRTQLGFGGDTNGTVTGSQMVLVDNIGGGTLQWTASSDSSWLSVSPASGSNFGVLTTSVSTSGLTTGTYSGNVEVSAPGAVSSNETIKVKLNVFTSGTTSEPFGEFSTPLVRSPSVATFSSSIPVTGWVLDDIGVVSVQIYNGSDYVGDAVFVEGARPDVSESYPFYPKNYQAGWGYMLLTNFLPGGGNGTYTLHAIAADAEGNRVTLGSKTITVDNKNAVKPFGAIDTPEQGGIASGSSFVNWGWALTPQPNMIPTSGSTIDVWVDGVKLGNPVYNVFRSDIASLFPGYANSNGAVGYFYLDTTAYSNGSHTIQWTVKDDAGNSDGIGSRYFNIQNTGSGNDKTRRTSAIAATPAGDISKLYLLSTPVRIKKGFRKDLEHQSVYPDKDGAVTVEIKELERLEIQFTQWGQGAADPQVDSQVETMNLSPLPIGSTLDGKDGIFYWSPGPGFLGNYEFVFIRTGGNRSTTLVKLNVKITPRF